MPASDINTYALSIEFALQDKATPTLDIVDQRLGKVEEQVSNLATKSLTSMKTITDQLNVTLSEMARQYDKISASSNAGLKPIKDGAAIGTETGKKLAEEGVLLRDKILKSWIEVTKILANKEKLLTDESKLIEKETEQMKVVSKELNGWTDKIANATKGLQSYLKSLLDIKAVILEAINATEMFKNANYRLYGSQSELVGRAYNLSMQYGIMRGQAMEAISVLGNMKVPNEMLDKMVETTVKFNRLSGVSIAQSAMWQKQMVALGGSSADVERRMTHMAVAMRRFGLDTQDVTAIMRAQQEQAQYLRTIYGDKMTGEIQRAQVAVAAFAKELGATPEVAQQAAAALGSIEPHHLQILAAQTGVTAAEMQTAEGQTRAMAIASANLAQQLRNTHDPYARQALLLQMQGQYGEQLGTAMFNLAQQQAAANSTVRDGAQAQDLMRRALNGHIGEVENLNDIYQESNQTISAQLGLLKNAFFSAIGSIWSKIEPAVIMMLQWLNTFVQAVIKVVGQITAWLDSLGPVGTTLKYIAAGVMIAVVVFVILVTVLNAFGLAARLAGGAGGAMGTMIQKVLEGMARGLSALAAHQITMLVLAVLLIAMGLGALFFAMGVAKIAEHGTAGIKALLALAVAIILVAVSLIVAATIAGVAWPVLLALAVVLLAAGVAAWLFAQAVKTMADVGSGSIGALLMLALTLVLVGLALVLIAMIAMPVIPAIYAIAIAILIVAVAALIFAVALNIAIGAMERFTVGLAVQILGAALVMIAAGIALIVASVVLVIGAVILAIAGVFLAIAGVLIFVGAGLLYLAATFIEAATLGLAVAGLLMIVAGVALIIGSIFLIIGAVFVLAAAIVLAVVAIPLIIAGVLLLVAAIILGAAGLLLLIAGLGVYLGGQMMVAGAPLLAQAAWPLMKASFVLLLASPFLLVAAVVLAVAGVFLLVAGIGILLGGLFVFLGASLLIAGATMIAGSAWMIAYAGLKLVPASLALIVGGAVLIVAAVILFIAAAIMLIPAILLAVVGILLLIAGIGILLGGMMIRAGAWFLLGAGDMLLQGSGSLFLASLAMIPAAVLLAIGAIILIVAAVLFLIASILLLVGGAIFFVGALLLAMGAVFFEVAAGVIIALAPEFAMASFFLMLAGIFLVVGSVLLLIGGVMMIAAAVVLLVAGLMLKFMSGPIISASEKLLPAGERFMIIGQGFMMGGMGLLHGARMMRESVGELRAAGRELAGIAGELEANLAPLESVAALANRVSWPIMMLGHAVKRGAMELFVGALWLKAASTELYGPTITLYYEAYWLYTSSIWILNASANMLNGSTQLKAASDLLASSANNFWWLSVVADMTKKGALKLWEAAFILSAAADEMEVPALKLFVAGGQIFDAALSIQAGAAMLDSAADVLISASTKIIQAVDGFYWLWVIGRLVQFGGQAMLHGAVALSIAIDILGGLLDTLFNQSVSIAVSAMFFREGGANLLVGAVNMYIASLFIMAAVSGFSWLRDLVGYLERSGFRLFLASFELSAAAQRILPAAQSIFAASMLIGPAAEALASAGANLVMAAIWLSATEAILSTIGNGYMRLWLIGLMVADAAYNIVSGALKLQGAGQILSVAAAFLKTGATDLMGGATTLGEAGALLYTAASNIFAAAMMLGYARALVGYVFYIAIWVSVGADLLTAGAMNLGFAAAALLGPAFVITFALTILAMAAFNFITAMSGLRQALMEPLGMLLTVFASEATAASVELFDAMDTILSRLESYADKMGANSAQIARAFRGILPTMPMGIIGMSLINAQSFTTTRTKDSADTFFERGEKAEARQQSSRMLDKLDEVATKIGELTATVKEVTGGGGGGVKSAVDDIVQLLRDHLPGMARGQSSGLAHALNEWMR